MSRNDRKARVSESFPVFDGHADILYMMMTQAPCVFFSELAGKRITHQRLAEGDVRVIVSAVYCQDSFNGRQKAVSHLQSILNYAEKYLDGLFKIVTADDLQKAFCGRVGAGLIPLLENADALIDFRPDDFKNFRFKVVGLTHAGKNRIGDGNGVADPGGLTDEGKKLVGKLESLGVTIDVAHLSEPGFKDLVDLTDGTLISSHTGFRRFCDLPRNLSDDQLRAIIARRGIIGMTVNPEMLSIGCESDINDLFRQIDWFIQKFGSDNIGLGSDFGGFDMFNHGLEHPGRFGHLAELFSEQGYPDKIIEQIMGENWYRFYQNEFSK